MKKERLDYLDGLRGLMSLNVIICHFIVVYFPQMYYPEFAKKMGGILGYFATTPLSVLVNGNIAVQYFFVLTGFLIGRTFCTRKEVSEGSIRYKIVNRYIRLLPMILASTLFTFITMKMGLQKHLQIADMVINKEYLLDYCNFAPTIINLLSNIFYRPFIDTSNYVGPFWTIRFLLWGYILCLGLCKIFQGSRWRRLAYGVALLFCWTQLHPNYIGFVLGVLVADICYCKDETILSKYYNKILNSKIVVVCIFCVGNFLACCPIEFLGIYSVFNYIPDLTPAILRAFGIAMIILFINKTFLIKKILSFKFFVHIGRISFPLYAFHWPMMLSLQAHLFSVLSGKHTYTGAALIAFFVTLVAIFVVSYLAWYWLEIKGRLDIENILGFWRKIVSKDNKQNII